MVNMHLRVFVLLAGHVAKHVHSLSMDQVQSEAQVFVTDACDSGACAIRSSDEALHMLQKGSRIRAARDRVNTTELMSSSLYEGYRWMPSQTTAACRNDQASAVHDGTRLTLAACKAKCLGAGHCMAFDFHNQSGQCSMFTSPCDQPALVQKGSFSQRLQIFIKSSAEKKVHQHESRQLSLTSKQEPELTEGEGGEKLNKTKAIEDLKARLSSMSIEELKAEASNAGMKPETVEELAAEADAKTAFIDAIVERSQKDEFENEYLMEQVVAAVALSLIMTFIITHLMHQNDFHILPEAAMVILQGVLLGLVLKYWVQSSFMTDVEFRSKVSIELLNLVFLPLLMFESGWSVRRLDFISQFPYILIFAVFGTLISTTVIGLLLYSTADVLHKLTYGRSCAIVAALISTTDPVATLSTYSSLQVDPLLNIIVFGEAAINDAVGIVVFSIVNDDKIMNDYVRGDVSHSMFFLNGARHGLFLMVASFALGLLVSTIMCWSLKVFKMRENKKLEIMVVFVSCYCAFALGEYFEVSGIICTLFTGMIMGKYARPHLSIEGSLLTSFFISQMCMIMDAGVFLLSGVGFVCLSSKGRYLGYTLLGACVIGRIASTVPCGILTNFLKNRWNADQKEEDRHLLSSKYLFMIWHAGLRGGIAENLAMQIGPWLNDTEGPVAKEAVRSAVFMVVCVYVLVFGGTTRLFLKQLGIPMGKEFEEGALSETESGMEDWSSMQWLNDKILEPLLVGTDTEKENEDVDTSIKEEADVEQLLRQVCHGHRSSKYEKSTAVATEGEES